MRRSLANDEAELDADHDGHAADEREHDTTFDGDDEHAPQHATAGGRSSPL